MRTARAFLILLGFLLMSALLPAQDLSIYRGFSFGMSLTQVTTRIGMNSQDATLVLERPSRIQELTWWPSQTQMSAQKIEPVQQVAFAFLNGGLYRITVKYDRDRTEGMTLEDVRQAISSRYGAAIETMPAPLAPGLRDQEIDPVARWENAQFRFELFQSTWKDYRLVMVSKAMETQATVATALALSLERTEGPAREAERQKKEIGDLAGARQKNKKLFRP